MYKVAKRRYNKKLKAPFVPYVQYQQADTALLRCNCGIIYWKGFDICPKCGKIDISNNQNIDLSNL